MVSVEATPDLRNQLTAKATLDSELPASLANMLRVYYNAGNYFLMSPFIFKQMPLENGRQFTVSKRNGVFQLLLLVFHLWTVFGTEYDHYYLSGTNTEANAERASLKKLLILAWTVAYCTAFGNFWTNGKSLCNVFNKAVQICRKMERLNVPLPSQATCTVISTVLILLVFFWSIETDFLWLYVQHLLGHYDFNTFLENRRCVHESQCFVAWNYSEPLSKPPSSWTNIVFVTLLHIGHAYWAEIALHYAYNMALLHGIFLFIIVRQFIQFIETNSFPHEKYNLVLDIVEEICDFCEILDEAIGSIVAVTCFTTLSYYSYKVKALFHYTSGLTTCRLFTDVSVVGTFLILSAHAQSKLGSVRNCLQKIRKTCKGNLQEQALWQDRLNITLHQLASGNIGIRGKFFTITYGFVGTMVSLELTYSLLISQLYSAE